MAILDKVSFHINEGDRVGIVGANGAGKTTLMNILTGRDTAESGSFFIVSDDEFFFGHKACAGCGGSLAVRAALKVLGPSAIAALPAGCMSAVGFNFPQLLQYLRLLQV